MNKITYAVVWGSLTLINICLIPNAIFSIRGTIILIKNIGTVDQLYALFDKVPKLNAATALRIYKYEKELLFVKYQLIIRNTVQ